MASVQAAKLVSYPWSDLFNLVLDVQSYPEFVPHCREVRLLSRSVKEPGVTVIIARMTVSLLAFEVGYSNRTTGEALDGPMRYLNVCWRFEPQDERHTKVHFSVSYEFSNPVLAIVASRVFTAMFSEMIDAFERRAAKLSRN